MSEQDYINKLKHDYRPSTRVQLDSDGISEANLGIGSKGTVERVDDSGQIFVRWDNGENTAIDPKNVSIKYLSIDDQIKEADMQKAEIIANKQRQRDKSRTDNYDRDAKRRD